MSDSEEDTAEKQFKIVIVGDPATGKTSVVRRLCYQEFSRQYFPTAGVDFFLKRVTLSGGRAAALHLWDVGGSALACNMLDKYVYGAHMVVLVYDIMNPSTLDNLEEWLSVVQTVTNRQEKPPLLALVANKSDMEHQRGVRPERQQAFTIENGLTSYLVSARSGENVPLCFQKLAAELLGVRLTRAEQELHQPVVRAEISNANSSDTTAAAAAAAAARQRHSLGSGARSAVCSLQ